MPNPVAAIAGGSVVSGLLGASAAKSGAKAQAQASDRAAEAQLIAARETNALQERMYNDTVARNEPARQIGLNALTQLSGMTAPTRPTGFQTSPGYQFQLQEGNDAIRRAASAGGMRLSGAALKDQAQFTTGLAAQDYGNWWNRETGLDDTRFNRIASIAGVGQTANRALDAAGSGFAGAVGATNTGTAANVGNALMAGGQARASGYAGQAQAFQNTLGGLGNVAGLAYGGYFGQTPGFGITPYTNPYARIS